MNVEPNTVAQIESGRNFVSCETLSGLSKYFKVSPSFFFQNNIDISNKNNVDCINKIKHLLPTLSEERLNDIYKIILLFQK
ncbi:helix-turn-helix transcriptional regulator [bacterium]|nr:helix-turn-helix transcriptional regulator [bacterium]